ncbi:CLUMA_CG018495, isoform A [Clunio marinus]|uniref:CLUMA_CG018495, isoform A n=1 Tax=Clunio marinus TaxID=568069 RepID=A0A1J1J297_9DIPT|nr:CLUMA_CG018495, isoform A [Clunio marinus]
MHFFKNRRIFTSLTSLFFIQLILILGFVYFGAFVNSNVDVSEPFSNGNIKFINKDSVDSSKSNKIHHQYSTPTFMKLVNNDQFSNHFLRIQKEVTISSDITEKLHLQKICFKEGVQAPIELTRASHDVNNKTEYYSDLSACICQPEWHGHACSEPEIIWRAFIASRQPMSNPPKIIKHPHNVFYIIEGVTSINMETLEIQMLELINIVNLFVICDLIKVEDSSILMKHQMNKGFLQSFKDQILLVKDETCSSGNVYRQMKKILGSQIHPLDVLIYGHRDEILNRKAVKYLKWHSNWPQPLRFRLKWNVYGFFFQHPDKTVISSIACQINVFEQIYGSDANKIQSNQNSPTIITVGDLNHIGGWFCEFCHQPIDIIRKLHLDSKIITNKSNDPLKETYHRKPIINIEFVQNLIQHGLYIDGKLQLKKLQHYNDVKYFSPESVTKDRWKFDNIVSNFFSKWDDGLENDDDY